MAFEDCVCIVFFAVLTTLLSEGISWALVYRKESYKRLTLGMEKATKVINFLVFSSFIDVSIMIASNFGTRVARAYEFTYTWPISSPFLRIQNRYFFQMHLINFAFSLPLGFKIHLKVNHFSVISLLVQI